MRCWAINSQNHFGFYSKLPSQVSVKVAHVSLVAEDIDEISYPIFNIQVYYTYDNSAKLHEIALLQV